MSVTQYIGARYVPLFATPEQWSSDRAYEPLTIVLHEGNSYTSKQAVPIGIDIQNNEFWALTGNYNAQVEAYRREVQEFDGRITENSEAIVELKNVKKIGSIIPNLLGYVSYNGEYTVYDHPGAICSHGGLQYIISSPQNEVDNTSHLRTVSIENDVDNWNSISTTQYAHANSICTNGEILIVAPVWNYEGGQRADANKVLICDMSGNIISQIAFNMNIQAVSFDWTADKFYALAYNGNIYTLDTSELSYKLVDSIQQTKLAHYNQDMAVYNGVVYMSSPDGSIAYKTLGSNNLHTIHVMDIDNNGVFFLGELDGFEFTENGTLLAVFHIDDAGEKNNTCFIANLPIDDSENEFVSYSYQPGYVAKTAYTQFFEGHNNKLRPSGAEQSPHKGLTIRKTFVKQYVRWSYSGNYTAEQICKLYSIIQNDGSPLSIYIGTGKEIKCETQISTRGNLCITGNSRDTSILRVPLPVIIGQAGNGISKLSVFGMNVIDTGSGQNWLSSSFTGAQLSLGTVNPTDYNISPQIQTIAQPGKAYIAGLELT